MTVHMACRLGQYNKDEPASFQLMPQMTFFPGFMFHMRRSQFVQVFGNSPDETAFARLVLMKELTQNCMLMIQPQVHAYSIASWEEGSVTAEPTVLDVQSIVPGSVLFLDTYFYIVVYHGNDIARWRQEGCAFTSLLEHSPASLSTHAASRMLNAACTAVRVCTISSHTWHCPGMVCTTCHCVAGTLFVQLCALYLCCPCPERDCGGRGAGTSTSRVTRLWRSYFGSRRRRRAQSFGAAFLCRAWWTPTTTLWRGAASPASSS
jgi:hypothetical protein